MFLTTQIARQRYRWQHRLRGDAIADEDDVGLTRFSVPLLLRIHLELEAGQIVDNVEGSY